MEIDLVFVSIGIVLLLLSSPLMAKIQGSFNWAICAILVGSAMLLIAIGCNNAGVKYGQIKALKGEFDYVQQVQKQYVGDSIIKIDTIYIKKK